MRIKGIALAIALVSMPEMLHAQRGLLDHAEARIAGGQFSDARGLLERWRRENPGAARSDSEQHARFLVLSARSNVPPLGHAGQ